jgi:hypothetical protein
MTKQGPYIHWFCFTVSIIISLFFLEFGLSNSSVQSTLWFYWDFINYDVLYLINCMILLGFELNATITKLKRNSTIKLI